MGCGAMVVVLAVALPSAVADSQGPNPHQRAAFLTEVRKAGQSPYNVGRFRTSSKKLLSVGQETCDALRHRQLGAYLDTFARLPDPTVENEILYIALVAVRTLCPQNAQGALLTQKIPATELVQKAGGRVVCVSMFDILVAADPAAQNPVSPDEIANSLDGASRVAQMATQDYERWRPLIGILSDMASQWRTGQSASPVVGADLLAATELCRPFIAGYKATGN
jgi:hypothetical protein